MSQTSVIAGVVIVAFIIFITVRGELPAYLGFLTGDVGSGSGGATGGSTAAAPTSVNQALGAANTAATIAGGIP